MSRRPPLVVRTERASGCLPTLKPCEAHLSRGMYRKSYSNATTAYARTLYPSCTRDRTGGATQQHRRRLGCLLARRLGLGYPKFQESPAAERAGPRIYLGKKP